MCAPPAVALAILVPLLRRFAAAPLAALAFAALLLAAVPPVRGEETTVSHGISPFGDLKYPAGFAHFDYANPDAPKGGTMSFRGTGASGTFDSLNAFILAGEPARGLGLLYDTLMVPSADEPGALYCLLCETVETPADRSWAIFTLRADARFNDGTPVTAGDVAWSFETLTTRGHPYYAIAMADVARAEALDARRIRFTFREEVATRDLPAEVGQMEVLPRHFYDTVDFTRSSLEKPLGSGPYIVDRADPGRRVRYCRAPDYWGADLAVNAGRNTFDCVVYKYFADTTAAFEALKVGDYLFHEEFSSAIWGSQYDFPALGKGWVVKAEVPDGRPSGTQGFWFNLRRDKFADIRVRQAISLLFNFEWSNETLFYGLYKRTESFWANAPALEADGPPEGAELAALEPFREHLPPEIFTEPAYRQPVWSTRQLDRNAIREASALLDAAGWPVGSDGLRRNAAGEVLSLAIVDDNAAFQRVVDPFLQNLRQAGIDARLDLIDPAQMQERQKAFDYDMTTARLVMSLSPSVELRTIFGSQGAMHDGTMNFAGVSDPVVDGLIESVIAAPTRPEMEARVRALDRVLRAKQIWVPNWYRDSYWLAWWDIFGIPPQPPYSRNDTFWWIDQGRLDRLRAQGALR